MAYQLFHRGSDAEAYHLPLHFGGCHTSDIGKCYNTNVVYWSEPFLYWYLPLSMPTVDEKP